MASLFNTDSGVGPPLSDAQNHIQIAETTHQRAIKAFRQCDLMQATSHALTMLKNHNTPTVYQGAAHLTLAHSAASNQLQFKHAREAVQIFQRMKSSIEQDELDKKYMDECMVFSTEVLFQRRQVADGGLNDGGEAKRYLEWLDG